MKHLKRRVVMASLFCFLSAHVVPPEVSPTANATVAEVKKIDRDVRCTATAIYREAGNQSLEGQIAVAQVILNRAHDYHLTTCQVVYQQVHGVKQFNWKPLKFNGPQFNKALKLATDLTYHHEKYPDRTGHATFFHAVYVDPGPEWTEHLVRTVRIQDHIFYRLPRRL